MAKQKARGMIVMACIVFSCKTWISRSILSS